jgi:ABC-2 type transport system permease protein
VTAPRHRLRTILTLAYLNGIIPIQTQPLYLVNVLASPFSFLFFIFVASQGKLLGYGVAGGMLLTILSIGTSLQTDMSHYRTDLKLQDLLVASPVEAPVYVAGLALSELMYSLPAMALFIVLLAFYTQISIVGGVTIAFVLLLIWGFASALGFTLATYFQDVRETFAISPLISITLSVLPPVYYPISYLPGWIRPFAYLSPTTYAADLLHNAVGLTPITFWGAVTDWSVLIAFTVALLVLASLKARWREP